MLTIQRIFDAIWRRLLSARGNPDEYLSSCSGVIHVGGSTGQERDLYAAKGLRVVWIEPLPEQFKTLKSNIAGLADQIAINALVTDRDGEMRTLHVASNNGESSSIFDLSLHKDIWPDIRYVDDLKLRSSTLPSTLQKADIDGSRYDALVLDTQGSELMILHGAEPILRQFKYIKTEAADFEAYRGCATVDDIRSFLASRGYRLRRKDITARRPQGGSYFELLFHR